MGEVWEFSYLRGRETEPTRNRPTPNAHIIFPCFDEEDLDEPSCEITRTASQSSLLSQGSSAATATSAERAKVYLRIRPLESDALVWKFRIENDTFIAANIDNTQTKNNNTVEQHYKFSQVFDDFASQRDIYDNCMKSLISLDESATVMVYGTSASGKTHTLLGDSYNPGLVPRALSQLFVEYGNNISNCPVFKQQNGVLSVIADDDIFRDERVKLDLLNSMADSQSHLQMLNALKAERNFEAQFIENCQLFLWVSFVEIYNENVYDLLTSLVTEENKENNQHGVNIRTKRQNLKVISNNGQPFVQGAAQIFVRNFEETVKILQYGMQRVSTGSTVINDRSSRSHCIFFVDLIKSHNNSITSISYKFCDLAGSERLKKTENIGKRLKEANNINKSLMTLGRCLVMANERQKNKSSLIPYRDSKLTTLLQNALLGHEKISFIVNLNPKLDYIGENLNVLNFASIAKEIVTKPKELTIGKAKRISRYSLFMSSMTSHSVTSVNDYKMQIENLLDKNSELEQQISYLNNEMVKQEITLRKSIVASLGEDYQRTVTHYDKQIDVLKMNYKAQTNNLKMLLEQKNKRAQRSDKIIKKLKAQIKQLQSVNDVYICDDSETESDDDGDSETDTSVTCSSEESD